MQYTELNRHFGVNSCVHVVCTVVRCGDEEAPGNFVRISYVSEDKNGSA
jgi:hypothetical protein